MMEVTVPDIGDFSDVPVIEILVSRGDRVAAEDPLVTLESDKATMDVPSPAAGTVGEIKVSVGDKVSEGDPLLTLEEGEGGAEQAAEPEKAEQGQEPEPEPEPEPEAEPEPEPESEAEPESEPEPEPAPEPDRERPTGDRPALAGADVYAGPGARRRARELGVDLTRIQGSGNKGRITSEDVEAFSKGGETRVGAAVAAGSPLGLDLPPWPHADYARQGPVEVQPLTRIQRIAGPNLQRNWIVMPHVTHNDEADITELEAFRKRINKERESEGVKMTMVALLIKACVAPLKEFPQFNSSLDKSLENLIVKRYFNIGFAADTPQGLVVPVIKDADKKGLIEISHELRELSGKAREGKLSPAEMSGATFTISSLGGIGGTSFTPIVNAPQVAILGVTRSAMKPVWDGSEFVPRLMLPLSLSYDHRVIDGAAAARWTVSLTTVLSNLERALL